MNGILKSCVFAVSSVILPIGCLAVMWIRNDLSKIHSGLSVFLKNKPIQMYLFNFSRIVYRIALDLETYDTFVLTTAWHCCSSYMTLPSESKFQRYLNVRLLIWSLISRTATDDRFRRFWRVTSFSCLIGKATTRCPEKSGRIWEHSFASTILQVQHVPLISLEPNHSTSWRSLVNFGRQDSLDGNDLSTTIIIRHRRLLLITRDLVLPEAAFVLSHWRTQLPMSVVGQLTFCLKLEKSSNIITNYFPAHRSPHWTFSSSSEFFRHIWYENMHKYKNQQKYALF